MEPIYVLYLMDNGSEELIERSTDPCRIRQIATGRSMTKRLKRPGRSLRVTKDNKEFRLDRLERLCLDQWFEDAETGAQDSERK